MGLVNCPECQKEVSTQALACPQCAFPYPGKQEDSEGKLGSCPDCGGMVSKQAQVCPHCGNSLTAQATTTHNDEKINEETWLCPHCGTPYTRKVRKTSGGLPSYPIQPSPEPIRTLPEGEGIPSTPDFDSGAFPMVRHPSPLWQDPGVNPDTNSVPHSKNKKVAIVMGLFVFVLVAVSLALGALWQFKGIHPLELLQALPL